MSDPYEKLRVAIKDVRGQDYSPSPGHMPSEEALAAAAEALADLGPLLDKLQRMHPFHAVCGCAPCQLWAAWTTARAKLVTT